MAAYLSSSRGSTGRATASAILQKSLSMAGYVEPDLPARLAELLLKPQALQRQMQADLGPLLQQVVVAGVLEDRRIGLELKGKGWLFAHLGGRPLEKAFWPEPISAGLSLSTPRDSISTGEVSPGALFRLTRPRIKLVSLAHPEVFPLPRFPLGISDLARAIRLRLQGEVTLADMQLGSRVPDLLAEISAEQSDIVGISATFGQYDLLEQLADGVVAQLGERTLLVFGGSLPALTAPRLLDRYPSALVATGPGEATMQDVVEYWHGDRAKSYIQGALFRSGETPTRVNVASSNNFEEFFPEMDLLEDILALSGVMQLESSRGCTHACSFCPREHKGIWAGEEADRLEQFLQEVGEVFERVPSTTRRIFLVDEEFIGFDRAGEGIDRALRIGQSLSVHGFRWETSSRIDQVYRPDKEADWHVTRMRFWSALRQQGLDRCLFGVESGVDSILKRFNKRTTARQNAMAIRLLSACGVPIRCTYITFDHLMSISELVESYRFLGRKDILLEPQSLPFDSLFEALHDEEFAATHAQGAPFYKSVSYMLVSMECLLGSPYLKKVEDAGLARDELPSMGRRNAAFLDPVIGIMSDCSQRWIDRNFSLDYLLKSLEKVATTEERQELRKLRALLKDSSYQLLGKFLHSASPEGSQTFPGSNISTDFIEIMDNHFSALVAELSALLESTAVLRKPHEEKLTQEYERWRSRRSWRLING